MNKTIEFLVDKKNNRERLDIFLSNEIKDLTRSYVKKLIEKNKVKSWDENKLKKKLLTKKHSPSTNSVTLTYHNHPTLTTLPPSLFP